MIWRIAGVLIGAVLLYALAMTGWHALTRRAAAPTPTAAAGDPLFAPPRADALEARRLPGLQAQPAVVEPPAPVTAPGCAPAPAFAAAAGANAASLQSAALSVFGRAETGWEIYAPLAAHEAGTACPAGTEGFAAALAAWQGAHRLPANGVMDPATLKAMNLIWLRRRPFVAANAHGACPAPPDPSRLADATPAEGYMTKPIQLRAGALDAYRRLTAAARAALPDMAADKALLTIFSGFRDPADDPARCAKYGNCGTITRANCSAHRTGLAMDIYLGHAPGFAPESSDDANRLYQSRGPAYRWMVANAGRFGFSPYPFEPWHWEWTGEAP